MTSVAFHLEALDEGLGAGQLHRSLLGSVSGATGVLPPDMKNPSQSEGRRAHGRGGRPVR